MNHPASLICLAYGIGARKLTSLGPRRVCRVLCHEGIIHVYLHFFVKDSLSVYLLCALYKRKMNPQALERLIITARIY